MLSLLNLSLSGILHGHTAGHLSVYTDPHRGISAEEQARLNRKRQQVPAHRSVASRILRKGAQILRDGIPNALTRESEKLLVIKGDPRNISTIRSSSVH